jgi:hypothetical protein
MAGSRYEARNSRFGDRAHRVRRPARDPVVGSSRSDRYWSDDVAEIVPLDRDAAYVRIELAFFNGHSCSISGIGRIVGAAVVYNDHSSILPGQPPCILSVSHQGNGLLIDDAGGSCKSYCGARGSLSRFRLPWKSRRPITYLSRLRTSRAYLDALHRWASIQQR